MYKLRRHNGWLDKEFATLELAIASAQVLTELYLAGLAKEQIYEFVVGNVVAAEERLPGIVWGPVLLGDHEIAIFDSNNIFKCTIFLEPK